MHIVGLGLIWTTPRWRRVWLPRAVAPSSGAQIAQQLYGGIAGAYEGALTYVGNPQLISRTYFGRYLVEVGVCSDIAQVFRSYLTEGKPGYVPHRWASLATQCAGSRRPRVWR